VDAPRAARRLGLVGARPVAEALGDGVRGEHGAERASRRPRAPQHRPVRARWAPRRRSTARRHGCRTSSPKPSPAAPQCAPAATSTSLAPTIRASSTIASGTRGRRTISSATVPRARCRKSTRGVSRTGTSIPRCSARGAGSARCPGPRPPSRAQARRAAGSLLDH